MRVKATPVERVAGLAFFAFTLCQVPFMLVESDLAAAGLIQLSPLQISAASFVRQVPGSFLYIQDVLTPGTWLRESLSSYLRCTFIQRGKNKDPEGCGRFRQRLTDLSYVRNGTNLPLLVELLDSGGLKAGQPAIVYGSMMITVSALFALYYSVKMAAVGFVLLGIGVYQGDHLPLPPAVFMAFLCIYAGFNLGEPRGNNKATPRAQQGGTAAGAAGGLKQRKGATVQQLPRGSKASPSKNGSSSSSSQQKQRKQA